MKTSRMSDKTFWRNMGRKCAQQGWAVDVALTKVESINVLIREGYAKALKDAYRKAPHLKVA